MFDLLSAEQATTLLLSMDADTLLECGRFLLSPSSLKYILQHNLDHFLSVSRTSSQLYRLVCQPKVWKFLLRGTPYFTVEKLTELVEFCTPGIPEMRSEVLREAARRKFSRNNLLDQSGFQSRADRARITLTVQSWGSPETFKVSNGYQSVEVAQILQVAGDKTTLVEMHHKSGSQLNEERKNFHLIVANVNHCRGELDKLGLTFAGLQREKASSHLDLFAGCHNNKNSFHLFTSLQKACKEWSCRTLYIDADKGNWADLAEIANTGHIDALVILSNRQLGDVKVENLRRVWQISHRVHSLRPFTSFDGGRGVSPEAGWKSMVEYVQEGRKIK